MASSPIVWTPDKRMILQSAVADLSPDAFQAVVGKVFGPATLAMRRRWSPRDVDFEGLEAASCESLTKALNEIHAQKHEPARRASVDVPARSVAQTLCVHGPKAHDRQQRRFTTALSEAQRRPVAPAG